MGTGTALQTLDLAEKGAQWRTFATVYEFWRRDPTGWGWWHWRELPGGKLLGWYEFTMDEEKGTA